MLEVLLQRHYLLAAQTLKQRQEVRWRLSVVNRKRSTTAALEHHDGVNAALHQRSARVNEAPQHLGRPTEGLRPQHRGELREQFFLRHRGALNELLAPQRLGRDLHKHVHEALHHHHGVLQKCLNQGVQYGVPMALSHRLEPSQE